MKTVLVTGGAGFIGSNFIRLLLNQSPNNYKVINLDTLSYSGNPENLIDIENDFGINGVYKFIKANICNVDELDKLFSENSIDFIINFAAETHVDRSILSAKPFIDSNIHGVFNLLEIAKKFSVSKFIQISTDEVYGSTECGKFTETSNLTPNSPYSASKASADLLVLSYHKTFGLPTVITRCSNNYGPYQFPEKLIPLMVLNSLDKIKLPVYGDGLNVRDWIHVNDHCSAILNVLENGKPGEVYNIGSNNEIANINIIKKILDVLDLPYSSIEFVNDRLGHDRRYAIDSSKIRNELGWNPVIDFSVGLKDTVLWYVNNKRWSDNVRSGKYIEYYKKQYGKLIK